MTKRLKLLLSVVLLLTAFLFGFVPQYLEKERVRDELSTANAQKAALERDARMAELRDLAASMLVDVLRLNYGSAKDDANKYFDMLRSAAEAEASPSRKQGFEELLKNQDSVINALSKADPASVGEVQALVAQTSEVTRRQ